MIQIPPRQSRPGEAPQSRNVLLTRLGVPLPAIPCLSFFHGPAIAGGSLVFSTLLCAGLPHPYGVAALIGGRVWFRRADLRSTADRCFSGVCRIAR